MAAKKHVAKRSKKHIALLAQENKTITEVLVRIEIPIRDIKKEMGRPDAPQIKVPMSEYDYSDESLKPTAMLSKFIFKNLMKKVSGRADSYWEFDSKSLSISISLKNKHLESFVSAREYIATLPYITKAEIELDVYLSDDSREVFVIEKIERKGEAIVATKQKPPQNIVFTRG